MTRSQFVIYALLANLIPFSASAQASENDALGVLISTIQDSGYSDINVIPRILSGYVVEAEKDNTSILLSLDAETFQITYAEAFEGRDESGFFFSPQRPLDAEVAALVAAYNSAVQGDNTDTTGIDPASFVLSKESQRTSGFFQQNSISVSDSGSASIKRIETLGILNGTTTMSTTDSTTGPRIQNNTDENYSLSTQKIERNIIFQEGSSFSSEVFTDREAFTNGIVMDGMPNASIPNTSQEQVIDEIISRGGEAFGALIIPITGGAVATEISVGEAIGRTLENQRAGEQQSQQ